MSYQQNNKTSILEMLIPAIIIGYFMLINSFIIWKLLCTFIHTLLQAMATSNGLLLTLALVVLSLQYIINKQYTTGGNEPPQSSSTVSVPTGTVPESAAELTQEASTILSAQTGNESGKTSDPKMAHITGTQPGFTSQQQQHSSRGSIAG